MKDLQPIWQDALEHLKGSIAEQVFQNVDIAFTAKV